MHPVTHVLAGWCAGNLLTLTPKERALCIVASLLPDIDVLSLIAGVPAYHAYHHVLAHGLTFGLVATLATTWLTRCSPKASAMFFALFRLHLVMDLFGSGPGWGIAYLWPWSDRMIYSSHAWSFSGGQNWVAFLLVAAWNVVIALVYRRTPLEWLASRLDALAVNILKKKSNQSPGP
jgi:hypothetical protein